MKKKKTIINVSKPRTSKVWCACGFRAKGPNHDKGDHHKKGKKEK